MLLFITPARKQGRHLGNSNTSHVIVYLIPLPLSAGWTPFKYISCYCLSQWKGLCGRKEPIQIHLMLLFILVLFWSASLCLYSFKYISCYCLSCSNLSFLPQSTDSNTSHVIVYRLGLLITQLLCFIQIHLMLLFIQAVPLCTDCNLLIQIHLMLLFIGKTGDQTGNEIADSNTSHVIVYLVECCFVDSKTEFKYISCYCLSAFLWLLDNYCIYSNTSHVIVYPRNLHKLHQFFRYSNTSHVIVYLTFLRLF